MQVDQFDAVVPAHVVPVRADLYEAIGVTILKANEHVCVTTELLRDRLTAREEVEGGCSARDVQHAAAPTSKVIIEEIQLDEIPEELHFSLTITTSPDRSRVRVS